MMPSNTCQAPCAFSLPSIDLDLDYPFRKVLHNDPTSQKALPRLHDLRCVDPGEPGTIRRCNQPTSLMHVYLQGPRTPQKSLLINNMQYSFRNLVLASIYLQSNSLFCLPAWGFAQCVLPYFLGVWPQSSRLPMDSTNHHRAPRALPIAHRRLTFH